MHIKENQLMAFDNRQQLARIKERNTKKIQRKKNFTKRGQFYNFREGKFVTKTKI